MKTCFAKEELEAILHKHRLWLHDDPEGERADLSGADLSGANLSGAKLSGAKLYGADLSEATLYGADLSEADLNGAILSGANLSEANLSEANLYRAKLYGANLSEATLYRANLSEADLNGAILYRANLSGAILNGAILNGANLYNANLYRADLAIACPEEGEFIGFKKVLTCRNRHWFDAIAKIKITEDAKRSSATGRKCRCSKAIVLSITNLDGSDFGSNEARSKYDETFIYRVGETVTVDNFDDDRWNECAPGIHFFITRQEAVDY